MLTQVRASIVSKNPQKLQAATSSLGSRKDLRATSNLVIRKGLRISLLRYLGLVFSDFIALNFVYFLVEAWGLLEPEASSILFLGISITCLWLLGSYRAGSKRVNYISLAQAQLASCFIFILTLNQDILGSRETSFPISFGYLSVFILGTLALACSRFCADKLTKWLRQYQIARHRVAVFASADHVDSLVKFVGQSSHYQLVSHYEPDQLHARNLREILNHLNYLRVDEVIIDSSCNDRDLLKACWFLKHAGITIHQCHYFEEVKFPRASEPQLGTEKYIEGSQLSTIPRNDSDIRIVKLTTLKPSTSLGISFWFKRAMDFIAAFLFLIVFSPVYLLLAALIYRDPAKGPVFYRQERVGLNGRHFEVWKFRTMVVNAEKLQKQLECQNKNNKDGEGVLFKIDNDPRITNIGKFLRRYSLDELPQVINVLLGEMSFVGPRPLPVRDVEKFSCESHHLRHEVVPGITGLWQVSGRSNITDFERVIDLDISYIKNWSIWLDLKILTRTLFVVLAKTGAY